MQAWGHLQVRTRRHEWSSREAQPRHVYFVRSAEMIIAYGYTCGAVFVWEQSVKTAAMNERRARGQPLSTQLGRRPWSLVGLNYMIRNYSEGRIYGIR